ERGPQMTEELEQRRAVTGERGEDEAAVAVYPWHPGEREVAPAGGGRIVTVGERNDREGAVGGVRPAVIRTDELAGRSRRRLAHGRAPMSAAVDEHVDRAVGVSRHDHGLARHPRREEVAGIAHLALVAEEQPGPAEQPLH